MPISGPLDPMPPLPVPQPSTSNGHDTRAPADARRTATVQFKSLPSMGVDTGTGSPALVRVWELPEPEPRDYWLEGLIPRGALTLLYADGGMYKSYIVLYICMLVLLGHPLTLAGRSLQRCRSVLFLDAELDDEEFRRRAFQLARGLGLQKPPEGLHYFQLPGALSNQSVQSMVRQVALACDVELSVLDSLTIASFASDPTSAPDVTGVMKFLLGTLGTAVCIDHISKPPPGAKQANLSTFRPFGSVFKGNLARSVVQVIKADGGGVMLRQTKHNFGPLAEPLYLGVEFTANSVSIRPITADTEAMLSGLEEHVPTKERVWLELARYGDGSTAVFLANELDLNEKTVRNKLTELKKEKRAIQADDRGRWLALSSVP